MSIATQITALQTDKTNIASAITAKGGTVNEGDGFDDFATDIATIPSGGSSQHGYKEWTVTITSDNPASPYVLVANDSDVLGHYNDDTAICTVHKINIQEYTKGEYASFLAANRELVVVYQSYLPTPEEQIRSAFGYHAYYSNGNNYSAQTKLTQESGLTADQNGNIKIVYRYMQGLEELKAGTYKVTFQW